MSTNDFAQQQALQKEFNELVLSLSQQVSKKYLLDANKNINKVNSDIASKLDNHVLLLNEASKNHLIATNKSITRLNENIPSQLNSQSLAIESIEKNLYQHHNEIYNAIKNESDNLSAIYEQQLKIEIVKVMQKMENSFKVNNSDITELKDNNHKRSSELQYALDTKIEDVRRAILYGVVVTIICIGLPLAFLIYSVVIR